MPVTEYSDSVGPLEYAPALDFGSVLGATDWLDGEALWAFTADTITQAQVSTLYAAVVSADIPLEDMPDGMGIVAVYPFDTEEYEGETWGYVDLDGTRLPQFSVEIDFTTEPTNPNRVWTSITDDVREVSFTRSGRNHEMQRTEAGSLSVLLDNRLAYYDPTNTDSPYAPGVKRMRWVRVRALWDHQIYYRWTGVIENYRQEWPAAGHDATCEITATDALKILNLYDLEGATYLSQTTGARVADVLEDVGLLVYTADTGQTTIVAAGPFDEGSSALTHLLQVEETENGLLFAEADGEVVFQGRHYRLLSSNVVIATIGDEAGEEVPYRVGQLDTDDGDVWNVVSVTPDGGTTETVTIDDSVDEHYARRLNRSLLTADQAEALAAAQYLASRYADPGARLPLVELVGGADPEQWPLILTLRNSDRLTWKRRADAVTLTQDVFVERVSDSIRAGDWSVALELSPADNQSGWVLGDATYGVLGSSTRLVY